MLDTGSSDTWFMQQKTQCLDFSTLKPISNDLCAGFSGPRLMPDSFFQQIPNTNMNGSYAAIDLIIGTPGYDNVSFGGIQVPKQEISLADTAAVTYPGKATGIIGLAYPSLTSIYAGEDPAADLRCNDTIRANTTGCNQLYCSPLMTTMFADGLVQPVFSFALNRGVPNSGVMAIGGLPNLRDPRVNVTTESVQATVPIEKFTGDKDYSSYFISAGLQYTGAPTGVGKGQFLVDTGTIPTKVDKQQADSINKLFDPPAFYNETFADYIVQCNATAPDLAVEIAGQVFKFNPKDLIVSLGGEDSQCLSGIQPTNGVNILGDVFLTSVLAVFDVGKGQISFASRVNYNSK
jgi:aspergillopepsin I